MADEEPPEDGEAQPTPLTQEVAAGGLSLLKEVGPLSFNYTKLDLAKKLLTDLAELHRYPALRLLDVSDNQLSDASQLAKLPALLSAKLDNNQLTSVGEGVVLEYLQLLSVKGNQCASVTLELPMLMFLNVDSNKLETLPASLAKCEKLKVIEARENALTTTAGIEGLEQLEEAYFTTNAITTLCLGPLPHLTTLNLSGNQLTSLEAFAANASALEHLDLSTNAIESHKELAHLAGLQSLRSLNLSGNPVADVDKFRNHVHAVLPSLAELDGAPYEEEDREPPPVVEEEAPAEEG